MTVTLRPLNPAEDLPALAALLSTDESEEVTPEMVSEWINRVMENRLTYRTVALDEQGHLVGYGVMIREPWMKAEHFYLRALTDQAWRGQGIGAALYDDLLAFLAPYPIKRLTSWVRDDSAESLRFAEARGFRIDRHQFESILDLATFDASPFAGTIEAVEATGIRFFSLADAGDTEEARRKLYELNRATALDIPGSDGTFSSFEEFSNLIFESSWYRPDGQLVAADGDQWVGLAALRYHAPSNSTYNEMTGVLQSHRGRRIAQALKLLSIEYARRCGAAYIRTGNDSENAPMLAINRTKLGYQPQPGTYSLIRDRT